MNYKPFVIVLAQNKLELAEQLYTIEKKVGVYEKFSVDVTLLYHRNLAKVVLYSEKKNVLNYSIPKVLLNKDNRDKLIFGINLGKVFYSVKYSADQHSVPLSKVIYIKPQFLLTEQRKLQPYPLMDPIFREPSIQVFFIDESFG